MDGAARNRHTRPFATALVTGGASGIGAAAVTLLEAEGTRCCRSTSPPGSTSPICGVGDGGPADFAFLNAGVATGRRGSPTLEGPAYRRALGANVDGVVFGVAADGAGDGARLVDRRDGLARRPDADAARPVYTLTKHAVVGFVRAVAPQLAERGIRINAVCPGFADTPIVEQGAARLGRRSGTVPDSRPSGWRRLRCWRRGRTKPARPGSSSPAASRSSTSSAACRGRDERLPHAGGAVSGPAGLPVRAELRRPGRPADALPRRGSR